MCMCPLVFSVLPLIAKEPLGYVSHPTINIGDDFQTIAAKRFLQADAVAVDREFIREFSR